jgi:hypothetical protein
MDGLDHGGTDYFVLQHIYSSTFKDNFQSHLFQKAGFFFPSLWGRLTYKILDEKE